MQCIRLRLELQVCWLVLAVEVHHRSKGQRCGKQKPRRQAEVYDHGWAHNVVEVL